MSEPAGSARQEPESVEELRKQLQEQQERNREQREKCERLEQDRDRLIVEVQRLENIVKVESQSQALHRLKGFIIDRSETLEMHIPRKRRHNSYDLGTVCCI